MVWNGIPKHKFSDEKHKLKRKVSPFDEIEVEWISGDQEWPGEWNFEYPDGMPEIVAKYFDYVGPNQ